MRLPQIRLESQMVQIKMKSSFGKQEIKQPKADLTIQQPDAQLSIETIPGQLTIDQTKAWEDMNLVSPLKSTELAAQEGYRALMEGIQRKTEQGDQLLQIESQGNVIVQQAIVNGHRQMKSLGVKYIPSHFSVEVHYQPSQLHVNVQTHKPIIDVVINKPEHRFDVGTVDLQIEKYNELNIDFTNLYSELT